jgi:hypothetical protein
VFVAEVPADLCDTVERTLIWQFREQLTYNNMGVKRPPDSLLQLRHQGPAPKFRT